MSEAQTTTAPVVAASEPVTAPAAETTPATTETVAPVTETPAAPATEVKAEEATTAAPETTTATTEAAAETKAVEPVTEGVLSYKAPGLVKSLIPSKKEFWLSDAPVDSTSLDSYLRGEKPDVSYPIVAWASQTGKGLLFFGKKGGSHEHPQGVLPLYEATQLKKQSPSEISFRIADSTHTLKAANDAERDGWFVSLEKAVELGKAEGESLRETEAYKSEMEKLYKPSIGVAVAAGAAHKRSVEIDGAQRPGSDHEEDETKKTQKSRSTSRGILNRLKGKKEEVEAKKEEKKEEKEEKQAEEKAEAETAEAAPVAAPVVAAPVEESKEEPAVVEEKPKASKRSSIFGWAGIKSPAKEKDAKEAELKPEVPAKEEAAPQIPEPVTTEAAAEPAITATPAVETAKEAETASPTQKSNFLSGLSFRNKRGRSVSPSTQLKEASKKEETAEPAVVPAAEPVATEPVAETAVPAAETASPVDAATEEPKTENKRQSVFGNLGRRASKALNRMQAPKKEATPATEAAKDEESLVAAAPVEADKPVTEAASTEPAPTDAAQASIGDVVPEAVNVGKPQSTPTVATTA